MIKDKPVLESEIENYENQSFEEILRLDDEVEVEDDLCEVETEPLCASCYAPLDVDEKQTIAYCDRCETTVFIERRVICPLETEVSSLE